MHDGFHLIARIQLLLLQTKADGIINVMVVLSAQSQKLWNTLHENLLLFLHLVLIYLLPQKHCKTCGELNSSLQMKSGMELTRY